MESNTDHTIEKAELSNLMLDQCIIGSKLEKAIAESLDQSERIDVNFWEVKATKSGPQLRLKQTKFISFLEKHGYYKYYQGSSKLFIRVNNNIITSVTIDHIRDFIRDYVEALPELVDEHNEVTREDLLEKIYKGASTYLGDPNLSFLKDIKPNYQRDTKDKAYIYYKNCFVVVSVQDGIKCYNYSELKGHIWEKQQIKRNFTVTDSTVECDFQRLVFNVSNKESKRYDSLRSAIGYLLHSYKDQSLTKAIIFVDEQISQKGEANGGTCKSLVAKGIEHMKSTWYRGKGFRLDKSFPYQGISVDTQICLLDDVQESFSIEPIFTNITNSLTVEGKGQPAFTIDFKDSPKWFITTNYVIGGYGNSYDRRRHIVEFSDHYVIGTKPKEEFGRALFDWPEDEWNRFDTFLLECLHFYMINGLQEVRVNYEQRALLQSTSEEFVSFMDALEFNVEYDVKTLKMWFLEKNEDYYNDKEFTTKRFIKWIRVYIQHKKILCQGDTTASEKKTGHKNKPFEERNGSKYLKMLY